MPGIRDSNNVQAQGIRPLEDQTCFRIAWRLRTNIKCFREVLTVIFLDILKTNSVRHAGEVLKTMRIHKMNKGRQLSLPQTKGNVWNRLRFLQKHFMFLEELNRRICENGINLRLSCIYLFQNISQLPDHCHKTQRTLLSFRDPWVPVTFFPAVMLVVCHIPVKIREKNNVLTQRLVNVHTKPLSEKQSL